jgi:hypothetical protein
MADIGTPKVVFTDLAASLKVIQKASEKALLAEMRRVGNEARDYVRAGHGPPYETGALRKSVKTSVRRKSTIALYSNLPQAPVWEWGGTIRPRGVPINIPKTQFVTGAAKKFGDHIDDELAVAFDRIAAAEHFT